MGGPSLRMRPKAGGRLGFSRLNRLLDEVGAPLESAVAQRRIGNVASERTEDIQLESLELPVEELLRRAKPLPSLREMAIEDLTEEEAQAFLDAINS